MSALAQNVGSKVNIVEEGGLWIAQSTSVAIPQPPTRQSYEEFQQAYVYFNQRLFAGVLPDCLITMQRRANSLGYFCYRRFESSKNPGERTDEIALNPSHFAERTETGVLSTLVHEMAHLWQCHYRKHPRPGYHSRQWADRMITLGLYPSNTGEPGGKETGYRMTHYIVEGGPFDRECRKLLADGFRLSWLENMDLFGESRPEAYKAEPGLTDNRNRWKYRCPGCGLNVWGKPHALVACGACSPAPHVLMIRNTQRG